MASTTFAESIRTFHDDSALPAMVHVGDQPYTRARRERRLSAPAYFQPPTFEARSSLSNKRAAEILESGNIDLEDDIDALLPRIRTMGTDIEDTQKHSPSMSFILDEGQFSFYDPSPTYSSGPSSLNTSPYETSISRAFITPVCWRSAFLVPGCALEGVSISGVVNGSRQLLGQVTHTGPISTTLLQSLDPALSHYAPVQEVVTHATSPVVHLNIPSATVLNASDIDSLLTISSNLQSPVHMATQICRYGSIVHSQEALLGTRGEKFQNRFLFSTQLPREMFTSHGIKDTVAVMRFIQRSPVPDSHRALELLTVICSLRGESQPGDTQIEVSLLWLGSVRSDSLPMDVADDSMVLTEGESQSAARKAALRHLPKLSLSIPPAANTSILLTQSPEEGHRPSPMTGIPVTALPMTPQEQIMSTPSSPPEIPRNPTNARAVYMPTPSDMYYPFTLSTTTPGLVPSPAFGVLDGGSPVPPTFADSPGAGGSAPLMQSFTPFTPSFFGRQQPHTASNTMHSITQRALNAGTPTFPHSPGPNSDSTYHERSLASPHNIVSGFSIPTGASSVFSSDSEYSRDSYMSPL
ncbi:hypothetical protein M422DRAFT_784032 [Sphaerobolus stellatus SS14]|uniref:Uncharacterized protein n=1 Tax=Sphaerobolus stellatus (strain SS14) TaxID=990650 RepID=A0A0C9TKL5_SPHS4|nr:hypothetical protein M422DRAFT_784032 [Sphaerobolus stellatus SS14]